MQHRTELKVLLEIDGEPQPELNGFIASLIGHLLSYEDGDIHRASIDIASLQADGIPSTMSEVAVIVTSGPISKQIKEQDDRVKLERLRCSHIVRSLMNHIKKGCKDDPMRAVLIDALARVGMAISSGEDPPE